ncbi:MAG: hypothetical protein KA319_03605 [Ferruginibacter sp.]|nr:hypothetical protein [Ferruginibacter sp.]
MKQKLFFLFLLIGSLQTSVAQDKNYAKELSVAFNKIYNELPNSYCKNLYGSLRPNSTSSYNSTVKLPLSVDNRFDIDSNFVNPLIFMSYVGAGKDVKKAAAQLKKIGKIIESMVINYNGENYKIKKVGNLSKDGERPDFKYQLINPPLELEKTLIYIRLDDTFLIGNKAYTEKNKWQFTMGLYTVKKK